MIENAKSGYITWEVVLVKYLRSAEHRYVDGELQRSKKPISIRGLNRNHHHDLKNLFKSAAAIASAKPGPFQEFYVNGSERMLTRFTGPVADLGCHKTPSAGASAAQRKSSAKGEVLGFARASRSPANKAATLKIFRGRGVIGVFNVITLSVQDGVEDQPVPIIVPIIVPKPSAK
jgi:hypothetical protein